MAALVRHLSANGRTAISQQNWPTIVSDILEAVSTPLKFAIENRGDRVLGAAPFSGLFLTIEQVGANDGHLYYFTAYDASGTLSRPWGDTPNGAPEAAVGASGDGGVWSGTGLKGVVVTAVNAMGETIASVEATFQITATTQRVTIQWEEVPGAEGYRVYVTGTPGNYSGDHLVADESDLDEQGSTTLVYDGTAAEPGAPPTENTTGGAGPTYGTPPDDSEFDQVNKAIGELAIGQQWFYWARLVVPPGTTEVGNRRAVRVLPREI